MTDRATRPADAAPATESVRRIRLPQKLRNLELGLLVAACIINAGAIVLVRPEITVPAISNWDTRYSSVSASSGTAGSCLKNALPRVLCALRCRLRK